MKKILKKGLMTSAALGLIFALVPPQPAEAKSKKNYEPSKMTWEYKDDNGKWVKESVTKYTYNKKGQMIQETTTNYNRETDETGKTKVTKYIDKTKYKYNKKGQTTSIKGYDEKGKRTYSVTYKYKGRKIRSVTSKYRDGGSYKLVNFFNKHGISKSKEYENGKLVSVDKYKYKGKKLQKITTTNAKGKQISVTTYKYKGKRLVKTLRKDSDGSRTTDTYNKKERLSSSEYKGSDNYRSSDTYTYTKKGYDKKIVHKATLSDGSKEKETTTYTYKFLKKKYLKQRTEKKKSSYGYTSWRRVTYSGWKKR